MTTTREFLPVRMVAGVVEKPFRLIFTYDGTACEGCHLVRLGNQVSLLVVQFDFNTCKTRDAEIHLTAAELRHFGQQAIALADAIEPA